MWVSTVKVRHYAGLTRSREKQWRPTGQRGLSYTAANREASFGLSLGDRRLKSSKKKVTEE